MCDSCEIEKETRLKHNFLPFIILVGIVCVIYFPTLSFEFTNWDDPSYVKEVQAIQTPGWLGIKEILTKPIPVSHGDYIPVTMLSYWMDYRMWEFQPKGYHLTNLLLHALSAGLLFILLQRLRVNPVVSMVVAFLFALHPMNTEAVTWIAERKTVMAFFWMMLSFHAFLSSQPTIKIKKRFFYLSLFCYLLACLSKTAVIFFPVLLVAYQVFLARMGIYRSLGSVISFFVIAFVTGLGRLFGHSISGQMNWKPFATVWVQFVTIGEISEKELLGYAAIAEINSEHPLGRAVVNRAIEEMELITNPHDFKSYPGKGIRATIDNNEILIGTIDFLKENNIGTFILEEKIASLEYQGKSLLNVALNEVAIGLIAVEWFVVVDIAG